VFWVIIKGFMQPTLMIPFLLICCISKLYAIKNIEV
jgi:hypothetical protein